VSDNPTLLENIMKTRLFFCAVLFFIVPLAALRSAEMTSKENTAKPQSLTQAGISGLRGKTPWAVIKCKFKDKPQEPALDPDFIFGAKGMAGYWRDVSYGKISLEGTAIFGWYTLPYTLEEASKMDRYSRITACLIAANDVDTSQFYNVLVLVNVEVDDGAAGGKVILNPINWYSSYAAHEMGHGYGLGHSYDDDGVAYGDGWDIMSFATFGGYSATFRGVFGPSGPGLNAPNLDKLGWINSDRILISNGSLQTITLAALNHPETDGYFMAKIYYDSSNLTRYYTVEFRRADGWDTGIPGDAVLIHEVRDGVSYLMRGSGGPARSVNQTFYDNIHNVAITVLSIDIASSRATINIGRNEVWVDFNWPGLPSVPEEGTSSSPFNSLIEGVNFVGYGGTVNIRSGSSSELLTITKPVTLRAVAGRVTIGE
jgi:hypothetical protein